MLVTIGSPAVISIHAPREGSDKPGASAPHGAGLRFQSTLPVRGATSKGLVSAMDEAEFQSTLPVRGATYRAIHCRQFDGISIHAPREGSDETAAGDGEAQVHFNPRSP